MADKNYNEAGFFQKLNIFARIAGHTLVEKAFATLLRRPNQRTRPSGPKVW